MAGDIATSDPIGSTNRGECEQGERESSHYTHTQHGWENYGRYHVPNEVRGAEGVIRLPEFFRMMNQVLALKALRDQEHQCPGRDFSVEILPEGFRISDGGGTIMSVKTREFLLSKFSHENEAQLETVYFV